MDVSQDPRYSKGSYSFVRERGSPFQARIKGKLIDKQTKESLKIAIVKINDQQIKADTSGYYTVVVKPGSYIVTGLCYPYCVVRTKRFNLKTGDMVTINFQLLIDETPLIN
ncbi:hypothetical protein [Spirosoma koreense]